jgi:hypothetical protein
MTLNRFDAEGWNDLLRLSAGGAGQIMFSLSRAQRWEDLEAAGSAIVQIRFSEDCQFAHPGQFLGKLLDLHNMTGVEWGRAERCIQTWLDAMSVMEGELEHFVSWQLSRPWSGHDEVLVGMAVRAGARWDKILGREHAASVDSRISNSSYGIDRVLAALLPERLERLPRLELDNLESLPMTLARRIDFGPMRDIGRYDALRLVISRLSAPAMTQLSNETMALMSRALSDERPRPVLTRLEGQTIAALVECGLQLNAMTKSELAQARVETADGGSLSFVSFLAKSWQFRTGAAILELHAQGVDVNAIDEHPDAGSRAGLTPLWLALTHKCDSAVSALVDCGADTRQRNFLNGSETSVLDVVKFYALSEGVTAPDWVALSDKIKALHAREAAVQALQRAARETRPIEP